MTPRSSLKVLFFLWYPGYLRYWGSVVSELARRGHEVSVAFSDLRRPEPLGQLYGQERVTHLDRPTERADLYRHIARHLRLGADYVRYLHPRYADAPFMRRRFDKRLPPGLAFLARVPPQPARVVRMLHRLGALLEEAIPSSAQFERLLAEADSDVVVVSPLVRSSYRQTDVVKSAHKLRRPVLMGVASWDHLTTKGVVKADPDWALVWNEAQRAELGEFHGFREQDVVVTGAQHFDQWFDRSPSRDPEAFRRRVGLPAHAPFVLFVGSSDQISETNLEQRFVRRWVAALRASGDPALRDVSVLVRPHPFNVGGWAEADLAGLGPVAVWPRESANPIEEEARSDYFDSLFHSDVTVGINTSAMIESAIVGTPVLSVRVPEFAGTQDGTLHFHHLLPEHGGFLRIADSFDEHVEQLSQTLAAPAAARETLRRFVTAFVRPAGIDRPCTPLVADAVERAAAAGPQRSARPSVWSLALRPLLWTLSLALALPETTGLAKPLRRLPKAARRSRKRARRAARLARRRAYAALAAVRRR